MLLMVAFKLTLIHVYSILHLIFDIKDSKVRNVERPYKIINIHIRFFFILQERHTNLDRNSI